MIFKIYDCDFGIKYNGVNYDFTEVNNLTIEDPETTKLIRGANAGNKTGLVYKEGIKEPKRWSVTIMNMTADLKAVLDQAYQNKDRLDAYCISRVDGSSKMAKNAILSQQPQQLTIDETPDSMNVALVFETFDSSEVHKS
jgi:predicted transcriptional regulator